MKELSIIVASKNTRRTIHDCLDALVRQLESDEVEVVVIDASTDGSAEVARKFEQISLYQADPARLVPELWKTGIERSNGRSVAFTTANFIPAHNWITELRSRIQGDHAAIGGVFEKLAPDGNDQWAIYFLRYAPYLPSNSPRSVSQIAADNAVYQRWVFEKYAHLIRDGFWEHPVNQALRADGYSLFLSPAVKVAMGYFSPPGEFFLQRFFHGRVFGAERVATTELPKRLFYVLFSPLIPFIISQRVCFNVLKSDSHRGRFISTLPWILFYVLGWSLGEFTGYLIGKTPAGKSILDNVG